MPDPNLPSDLPPERSLDEETKARMRAVLTEQTGQPGAARGAPGWLVPAVAAAAVAGIFAVGFGLVSSVGDEGSPAQPRGGGTSNDRTVPSTAPPGTTPSSGPSTGASTAATRAPTVIKPSKGSSTDRGFPPQEPAVSCAKEVPDFLEGASELSSITYAGGTATLFGTGSKWIICDDWAATSDGGSPTLLGGAPTDPPLSKDLFQLSTNYSMEDADVAQFVAGGPLIDGVKSISYTFPDRHTEQATMNNKMWAMAYLPTGGPLIDGGRPSDSVEVNVTHDHGTTEDFTLQWALDTCAQINHGC